MDKHLIYMDATDGKVRIVPDAGYCMIYAPTKAVLSEAIVEAREERKFYSAKV